MVLSIRAGKIEEHSDIHSYCGSLGQIKEEKCCNSSHSAKLRGGSPY